MANLLRRVNGGSNYESLKVCSSCTSVEIHTLKVCARRRAAGFSHVGVGVNGWRSEVSVHRRYIHDMSRRLIHSNGHTYLSSDSHHVNTSIY